MDVNGFAVAATRLEDDVIRAVVRANDGGLSDQEAAEELRRIADEIDREAALIEREYARR